MSTRLIKLGGNSSLSAIISEVDYEQVIKHKWYPGFQGYPVATTRGIGKLHIFILPRTPDIPEKYVIDHANRNILDATRENLRFVSAGFNAWNRAVSASASSQYKGVTWDKTLKKWRVQVSKKHIGVYQDERAAFRASAKEVVRIWPLWGPTSDLLVGPGVLSPQEMEDILQELQQEEGQIPFTRELPCGVVKSGERFEARFRRKSIGIFATVALAEAARAAKIAEIDEAEWQEHLKSPILRDNNGHAIVALTGDKAHGLFSRVPEKLWHQLTFRQTWCISNGYATGWWNKETQKLHTVVYTLLHPDFVPSWNNSVDHIITEEKLNNDADNLRAATLGEQQRNKSKRTGTTSSYVGVSLRSGGTWRGQISINKKTHQVNAASELECARKLDALELSLVGDRARVRVPKDQPGVDEAILEAQQQQKQKQHAVKRGTSSKYVGVSQRKDGGWTGQIMVNRKSHTVSSTTEIGCAKLLDALEFSLLGAGARVRVPVEPTAN